MSFVHKDNKKLVALLKLDMENGPWIAGGACLSWHQGEPVDPEVGDIDVWFKSREQYDATLAKLISNNYVTKHDSLNASTLILSNRSLSNKIGNIFWVGGEKEVHVQLIKKEWFDSAQDILNMFDFSICKILTDGKKVIYGNTTKADISSKTLRVDTDYVKPDVLKRMTKYIAYGYTPHKSLLDNIEQSDNIMTILAGDPYDTL